MIDKIRRLKIFTIIALIYVALTEIRNWLYDKNLLKARIFNIPIISIGNITAGGTGKTPFVMFLIEQFKHENKKICVVSRGFGRSTGGVQNVSNGKGSIKSAYEGGDEPVLIAQTHRDVAVIVAEKRKDGIEKAIQEFNPDLIILDDAFQHRSVKRDCDIVLVDCNKPLSNEKILPVGNLREQLKNLRRADIIVFTKCQNEPQDEVNFIRRYFSGPVFISKFEMRNPPIEKDQNILAFAGIAQPDLFEKHLSDKDIKIERFLKFKDHVIYSPKTISEIKKQANEANCHVLITTGKDEVKLNPQDFTGFKIIATELKVNLPDAEKLLNSIHKFIDIKKRC